jgi:hypothetical protein
MSAAEGDLPDDHEICCECGEVLHSDKLTFLRCPDEFGDGLCSWATGYSVRRYCFGHWVCEPCLESLKEVALAGDYR